MPSKKNRTPIESGKVYHIFNRGNNYERIFFSPEDKAIFLHSFKRYVSEYIDIYAFALLINHFHLAIRIKEDTAPKTFSSQYSKWILHYTNIINGNQNRSGSLFLNPFKRLHINNEEYLKRLIYYIHFNPEKHKECTDFRQSSNSSYNSYVSSKSTSIARNDIYNLYGSKQSFIDYHQISHEENKIRLLLIE